MINFIKRILNLVAGKGLYNDYKKPKRLLKINHHLDNNFFTNQNKKYSKYKIGDYTYGKPSVLFDDGKSQLEIGKFCSIAEGVKIYMGGNHRYDRDSQYPFGSVLGIDIPGEIVGNGDIYIGNDVRIGQDVKILSGVKIGNGAVIGMGSLITKDIAPYSIVGGIPAKHIKYRFDQDKIDELEKNKWRDKDIKWISENIVNKK